MRNRIAGVLVGSFLIALILIPTISSARIYLFDKKLEINGSIEQKANWKYTLKDWERGRGKHNPNGRASFGGRYPSRGTPTMFKTHLHAETLYHFLMMKTAFWTAMHCLNGFTIGVLI